MASFDDKSIPALLEKMRNPDKDLRWMVCDDLTRVGDWDICQIYIWTRSSFLPVNQTSSPAYGGMFSNCSFSCSTCEASARRRFPSHRTHWRNLWRASLTCWKTNLQRSRRRQHICYPSSHRTSRHPTERILSRDWCPLLWKRFILICFFELIFSTRRYTIGKNYFNGGFQLFRNSLER